MLKKSLFTCLLVLFAAVSVFSQTTPEKKIEWQTNYKLALKEAQKSGKPVLIDFNADWCVPCKTMEKIFWSRAEIVELSEQFVCASVNYDLDRETVALFRVKSIPHVVFADPWGNMLAFHHGFSKGASENAIRAAMKNVHKDFSGVKEQFSILERDRDNAAALMKIGEFYAQINQLFLSNKYLKQALTTKRLKQDSALRENILTATAGNYLKQRDFDEAERIFTGVLLEFPNGARCETALHGLIQINIRRNKLREAETVFEQMKAKFPDSEITRQAADNLNQAKTQTN